jgi:peptidoglycan/xylan/chitin deacetylase (PgdA/CDA1 family)
LTSVRTSQELVGLTFDDGPDPRLSPAVLDVLRRRQVRATFFVVAEQVRRHPELARRMVQEGHEVGLHGDRHVDLRGLGSLELGQALYRGKRHVERVVGAPVRWSRPPYGKQNARVVAASRALGMPPVLWTAAAHDWRDEPVETQVARAAPDLRAGAVLLLHDGAADPVEPPLPPPPTQPRLLEVLFDVLLARGLRPVTVTELAAAGAAVREPWFERWLHG